MITKTKVNCPHCQVAIKVKPEHANKRGKCPACQAAFTIQLPAVADAHECRTIEARSDTQAIAETVTFEAKDSAPPKTAEQSAAAEYVPYEQFGRFQLRELLGQGSFGRVHLAFDPQLERLVALKVPTFDTRDARRVKRFLAEAKAAARLRHPNIVPTYESGTIDGQYYIASQFIGGKTLAQQLADAPPDFRQAAEWARQLSDGLAYAHDQGIVHRDIKPANIMLDEQGVPQIMDFGLAKRIDDDAAMTIDGTVMGTPAYMAPEQARGETSQVNAASDQYSLGVVLYEMLTGERPFKGPSHAVLASLLTETPPTPRDLRHDVPRDLDAICQRAMQKSPADRYVSAQALAQDLSCWLNGSPVKARKVSASERLVRWIKREPRVAALVLIAGLLLLLGIGVSSAFAIRSSRNLQLAERHAGQLKQALEAANTERTRANLEAERATAETKRAQAAEAAAGQRESEALLAKQEATAANTLAAERNQQLQTALDELKSSKESVNAKTAELTAAAQNTAEAETSRAKSEYAARLAAVRIALTKFDYDAAQQQLAECAEKLRDDEWSKLSSETSSLMIQSVDINQAGSRLYLDRKREFMVVGIGDSSDYRNQSRSSDIYSRSTNEFLCTLPGRFAGFHQAVPTSIDRDKIHYYRQGKLEEFKSPRIFPIQTEKSPPSLLSLSFPPASHIAHIIWSQQNGVNRAQLMFVPVVLDNGDCRWNLNGAIPTGCDLNLQGGASFTSRFWIDSAEQLVIVSDPNQDFYRIKFNWSGYPKKASTISQPQLRGIPITSASKLCGGFLVVAARTQVQVFDAEERLVSIAAPNSVQAVAITSNGSYVAGAWTGGYLGIWRVRDGSLLRTYKAADEIRDIEFDASGNIAWLSGKKISFWKLPDPATQLGDLE